jgi:hypothetical protein
VATVSLPADVDVAYAEGREAVLNGRTDRANPYISRCPGNNQGRHRRSRTGRCFECGDWPSKTRDRLRRAWDRGWRDGAGELRAGRAA